MPLSAPTSRVGRWRSRAATTPTTETFEEADPYRTELEEFAAAIRESREPAVGPREILGNARTLAALLASARADGKPQDL